jgi:hypothetical protein
MSRHERFSAVDRRGKRTPQTMLLLDERDRYLVEASRFYPGCRDREIARRLRTALLRYQGGRWRRTCTELRPPHPPEKIDAVLWAILKTKDYVPSEMTIRRALGYS